MASILKKFNSTDGFSVGDETVIDVIDANSNVSANYLSITNDAGITGNILPTGNNVSNLGNTTNRFKDLWLSGQSIYLGNSKIESTATGIVLTNPLGGTFTFDSVDTLNAQISKWVSENAQANITSLGNLTHLNISNIASGANGTLTANFANVLGNLISGNANLGNLATANYVNITANITSGNANLGNLATANYLTISNNLTVSGDANISGNLTVTGSVSYIESSTTYITDPITEIGGGLNGAAPTNDGKDRGTLLHYYDTGASAPANAFIGWDSSNVEFTTASNVTIIDNVVTITDFGTARLGNIISVGNITSNNANLGNLATANYITITGNLISGNANLGNLATANYITVTANLISGNADLGNLVTANYINVAVDLQATGNIYANNIVTDNTTISHNGDITTSGNFTITGGGSLNVDGGVSGVVGNVVLLGLPTDANLISPGATDHWTENTTITDAIDDLNEITMNVARGKFVGNTYFTISSSAGPSPLTVNFTSTYAGTATTYAWNFGDGTTSTSANPTKTYSSVDGGVYTVTLLISNSGGSGAGSSDDYTIIDAVTLYTPTPIASFTLDKTAVDTSGSVSLTNTSQYAQSYVIYWGDGTTSTIANNSVPGGQTGGAISHTYTVTGSADTRYQPYITATSTTAGLTPVTNTSSTQNVYVYKTHSPTYTYTTLEGNNDYTLTPNGWNVTFTNTTAAGVGSTSTFGAGNYYKWTWGDGTTSDVNAGSGSAGDRSVTITHKFSLSNPAVTQTFTVTLKVYNGYSTSPFTSSSQTVTVHPDPQAIFTGNAAVLSDRTSDSSQKGYLFTDLNGIDRAIFTFTNSSLNTDTYYWTWGDTTNSGTLSEGVAGTPTGGTLNHTYTGTGSYTVVLRATGTYSESGTDDTKTRTNYITVASAPAAPTGLSSASLSMSTVSVGTSPYLCASATDNTGGNIPSAGTSVTRYLTGTANTSTVADIYNAYTGTLSAIFNGSTDGSRVLTSGSDVNTYGNLVITVDRDAHAVSASTYPSNFYKVFSAYHTKAISSVSTGYNDVKLTHSDTGNSARVGYVKDDVSASPVVSVGSATLAVGTSGTYRYISGIPYFNTGSPTITLAAATVYNWIGQTYYNSSTPFAIDPGTNDESTTGNVITAQTKTYSNLDGTSTFLSGGIPIANTGKDSGSAYSIGNQSINVAPASIRAVQTIKFRATNVNGVGAYATHATKIQVFTSTPSGFVEDSITTPAGATTAKRIVIAAASGANPTFSNSTNYYTSYLWSGAQTIAGTDEAVVRWNQLTTNTTNFSTGYLPVGPDLSATGGRTATQYFRGAFTKASLQNISVTITGKISGLYLAAPGTAISTTSTLNGWLNASLSYSGTGVPGAGVGGNGSNGCAVTVGDRVQTGTVISGTTYNLTLGSENLANAFGNQLLFCIVLASGDYVTSWSFS
jgi:PKD repeat protein